MRTLDFIVDDFAAGGGWEQGIRQAGYKGRIVGIEFEKWAVETARAAGHERVHGDVRQETSRIIDELISAVPSHRDVVWLYIASPPCQTFSAAGKGAGRKHLDALLQAVEYVATGMTPESAIEFVSDEALDERSVLVLHPLQMIRRHRPTFVLLEQVSPVLPVWEAYADYLRGWGYAVHTEVVTTERYGVAQTRKRAILSASLLHDEAPFPVPTHSAFYPRNRSKRDEGVLPFVTMAEALAYGMTERPSMTVTGGGAATGGAEPFGNGARKGMRREIDEGRWAFVPTAANEGTTAEQMSWTDNRPSPTIVGSFAADVIAAPGYRKAGDPPRQKTPGSVRVTVEQCGILQSFPADYPWRGPKTAQHQIVGNAVPPLLAQRLYEAVVA